MTDYPVIQGKVAHSWPEVWICQAMDELKIKYQYQYTINIPGMPGSYVIDWVVYRPFATAMEYKGPYWHRNARGAEERMRDAIIAQMFNFNMITLSAEEGDLVEDLEDARNVVRRRVK